MAYSSLFPGKCGAQSGSGVLDGLLALLEHCAQTKKPVDHPLIALERDRHTRLLQPCGVRLLLGCAAGRTRRRRPEPAALPGPLPPAAATPYGPRNLQGC